MHGAYRSGILTNSALHYRVCFPSCGTQPIVEIGQVQGLSKKAATIGDGEQAMRLAGGSMEEVRPRGKAHWRDGGTGHRSGELAFVALPAQVSF